MCRSDEHGDKPRSLPIVDELKAATDVFDRKLTPAWDYKVPLWIPYKIIARPCSEGSCQLISSVNGMAGFNAPLNQELNRVCCLFGDLKEGVGWGWTRDPPASRKSAAGGPSEATQKRKQLTIQQRLLKGWLVFLTYLKLKCLNGQSMTKVRDSASFPCTKCLYSQLCCH